MRERARTRPAVVLTGPRQSGKTALAKRLFPEHHYVSLDLPSEAAQAEGDPSAFFARHPAPLGGGFPRLRCGGQRGDRQKVQQQRAAEVGQALHGGVFRRKMA